MRLGKGWLQMETQNTPCLEIHKASSGVKRETKVSEDRDRTDRSKATSSVSLINADWQGFAFFLFCAFRARSRESFKRIGHQHRGRG